MDKKLLITLIFFMIQIINIKSIELIDKNLRIEANAGESVTLYCESDEYDSPDRCRFFNPKIELICQEDELIEVEFDKCVTDNNIEGIMQNQHSCELIISKVIPDQHYGSWSCQMQSFGFDDWQEAIIDLQSVDEIEFVEFVGVWGEVTLGLDKYDASCAVRKNSLPGQMKWYLDDELVHKSSDYQKTEYGDYVQHYNYTPEISDGRKQLTCSVAQGKKDFSDSISIKIADISLFKSSDISYDAQEKDEITINKKFAIDSSSKEPEINVYWEIMIPNNDEPHKLLAGESFRRFQSEELSQFGDNKYSATLKINPVAIWDDENSHKLVVEILEDSQILTQKKFSIDLNVAKNENEPLIENEPTEANIDDKTSAPIPNYDDSDYKNSTETKQLDTAGTAGVSMYIIVIIIVVVILLCCLYYCCKCKSKKEDKSEKTDEKTNETTDLENGDSKKGEQEPLITSNQDTVEKINEITSSNAEENLAKKLDPETELSDKDQQIETEAEVHSSYSKDDDENQSDKNVVEDSNEHDLIKEKVEDLKELVSEVSNEKTDEHEAIQDNVEKLKQSTQEDSNTEKSDEHEVIQEKIEEIKEEKLDQPSAIDEMAKKIQEIQEQANSLDLIEPTEAVDPITPSNSPHEEEPPSTNNNKDWKNSELFTKSHKDSSKAIHATASPPASPASTASIKSNQEENTWKEIDSDENPSSNLSPKVDEIIQYVKSNRENNSGSE